jgi:GNAT superfamily N-acetyltransferase
MDVRPAETEGDCEEARRLFRAFVAWHREYHPSDLARIDAYFDEAAWEHELAGLPGAYGPPTGTLLLASEAGVALGCVAAKRIDDESCEMKRLFVPPMARGLGVGRALAEELIRWARGAGYRRMYLDTSMRQTEAVTLYRDLGFEEVEAYYDVPEEELGWLVFFKLDL